MKNIVIAVVGVALVGAGVVAYRSGWIGPRVTAPQADVGQTSTGAAPATRTGSSTKPATAAGTSVPGTAAQASGPSGTQSGSAVPAAPLRPAPIPDAADAGPGQLSEGNLALLDAGAEVAFFTSQHDVGTWAAARLIDSRSTTGWCSRTVVYPHDIVVSFFAKQPALVGAVVINPGTSEGKEMWVKDVEIWTSMQSPTEGFSKVAEATLRNERVEQLTTFPAVEARYVKLRILSNYGSDKFIECGTFKVIQAKRAGYASLLERHQDLAALLSGTVPAANPTAAAAPPPSPASSFSADGCVVPPPASALKPPAHAESQKVLLVAAERGYYPPTAFKPSDKIGAVDYSLFGRVEIVHVTPKEARQLLLLPAQGFDTVVLSQLCDIKTSLSDAFKRDLAQWVADGHKLIIQDSDRCGGGTAVPPDYSFLPFPFATSNPGKMGSKGQSLMFVEENTIGNGATGTPGFINLESWLKNLNGDNNELGDSNTVVKYDARWCGHLFGTNALKKNGFMEAYAHSGRGLIIYNGFDVDQYNGPSYRQLVTRELAQGFDPDNLPCSAPIGDFVIATEQRLKRQLMKPGQTFGYPLQLLSNQAYKGTIKLTAKSSPPDPTFDFRLEPDTIELTEISPTTLTVKTTGASLPASHVIAVRGTDTAGKTNLLCLTLAERTSGSIRVMGLERTKKPTRNLEIILDASGSMKLPMGKKTRWTTALDVLKDVVAKLPDDFNVGLRVYGHRESSTSPKTCTDSQLVVPLGKLNRDGLLAAAGRLKPRGETPLVYSVLQTASDLKAARAGTVIVITDGEESCKGDPKAAVKQLQDSGIDVTLNIVGFTLTDKNVRGQLTTFAESTGGHFYGATTGETLARAVLMAAVEKLPYTIFDASGRQVASGEAGGTAEELPPGEYKVVIRAGDQELTSGPVVVAVGADTVLKVVVKGDHFAIER